MICTLTDTYKKVIQENDNLGPWKKALDCYLSDQSFDIILLKSLLEEINSCEYSSFEESIVFLKKILFLSIISKGLKDEKEIIEKVKKITFSQDVQIIETYKSLIFYVLEEKYQDLKLSKNLFYTGQNFSSFRYIDFKIVNELAVFLAILADKKNIEEYKTASKKIAYWQLNLLAKNNLPFIELFSSDKRYNKEGILYSFYILFLTVGHLNGIAEMKKISVDIFNYLKNNDSISKAPLLYVLLSKYIENIEQIEDVKTEFFIPNEYIDEDHMVIKKITKDTSAVFTFNGYNSGLGCIYFKDLKIKSFGPGYLPLSDTERYGIFNSIISNVLVSNEKDFSVKAWTKLFEDDWIEFSCIYDKDKIKMKFSKASKTPRKIVISFYIDAKKAVLDNKLILPNSLEHNLSKAKNVTFNDENQVTFSSNSEENMHLIPLAGEKYFWGSSFLLAYETCFDKPLELLLTKS